MRTSVRPRFTIRRLMIVVAVFALALVTLPGPARALVWLWRTPGSANLLTGHVENFTLRRLGQPHRSPWLRQSHELGKPVFIAFDYDSETLPAVPAGVPFVITVSAELFDWKQFNTPVERSERVYWVVAGHPSLNRAKGRVELRLVPRTPGTYGLRFQVHATDLLGRSALKGRNTASLTVR
ncbi:MAG: hypothetical protein U0794_08020 [Isosphaeraceae bacterium]